MLGTVEYRLRYLHHVLLALLSVLGVLSMALVLWLPVKY